MLAISNLRVRVETKQILNGVNLKLKPGELVAIMGPNGSGKSTLAYTLAGHPGYEITSGKISLNGKAVNKLSPDKRSKMGLFLGFQYPVAVAGVDLFNLLRQAYISISGKKIAPFEFKDLLKTKISALGLDKSFINRSVNDGFSGGEKKKSEILQLAVLKPKYAILDEIDSGLDIDAVKIVARAINQIRRDNPQIGILLITHYQRILDYLTVDRVIVMKAGKVVKEGSQRLVDRLEKRGYAGL
ncbi:MAG: Fe-S cluster assembly ATPase SufC [Candidatus Beckwithbacteria bacterium]|nr:Fe-S cluster assembly ATPase SufC [Patescibacteria group bacterium]MDP4030843.1 Fe-S cluster assembly ATPase SufC [Candidatus Beckwithbacteria bacterium]